MAETKSLKTLRPNSVAQRELRLFGRYRVLFNIDTKADKEPVIVTVNGAPAFQLVPLGEDDDLIDRLLEPYPAFGRLLERRLKKRTVSVTEAARRL